MKEECKISKKGKKIYVITFDGKEYKRYPDSKHPNYYYRKWKSKGHYYQQLLHHAIYKRYNGPIPQGKVVHHIDKNPFNNDITNLLAVTASEHSRLHSENVQKMNEHRSPNAGFTKENWHKRRDIIKKNLAKSIKLCEACKKEFTPTNVHQRFCSKECHHRWQYTAEINLVETICQWCGKVFMHNKYLKQKCCSEKCAHLLARSKR